MLESIYSSEIIKKKRKACNKRMEEKTRRVYEQ